jgi:hypothetical protein
MPSRRDRKFSMLSSRRALKFHLASAAKTVAAAKLAGCNCDQWNADQWLLNTPQGVAESARTQFLLGKLVDCL